MLRVMSLGLGSTPIFASYLLVDTKRFFFWGGTLYNVIVSEEHRGQRDILRGLLDAVDVL